MNKIKLYSRCISLVLSGASLVSFTSSLKLITKEKPIKLSSGIEVELDDGVFNYDYVSNTMEDIHKNITKTNLKNIKYLNIDCSKTNFDNLIYFPNLEKICLCNIQCLTIYDKQKINKLEKLTSIIISFPADYILENKLPDISWCDNKNICFFVDNYADISDLKDMEKYILYENLVKLKQESNHIIECNFISDEDIEKFNYVNDKVKQIVKSFNFTDDLANSTKLIKLVDYVCEYLDYDKEIMNSIVSSNIDSVEDEIINYNNDSFKFIYDINSNDGICINYAAFLYLLGKYSNIDIKYETGIYDNKYGHAWCRYDNKIIDPTNLDYDDLYKKLNADYKNNLISNKELMNVIYTQNKDLYSFRNKHYFDRTKNIDYTNSTIDSFIEKEYIDESIKKALDSIFLSLISMLNFIGYNVYEEEKNKQKTNRK